MQSKGAIRFVAILLLAASIWQLSFTAINQYQENRQKDFEAEVVEAAMQEAKYQSLMESSEVIWAEKYLDTIRREAVVGYLDTLLPKKALFGYTFKDVREKSLNLGLDLKGGMNLILQVELKDLVKALGVKDDATFNAALDSAVVRSKDSRTDFITLFIDEWKEASNNAPLAQAFGTYDLKEEIKTNTSDEDVERIIRGKSEDAIAKSFEVLRNRIDRFGVIQPNIQEIGTSGRILIELPGVKDVERVRKLLQGTATLEFWETSLKSELDPYLATATTKYTNLSEYIIPAPGNTACLGYVHYSDTAKVMKDLAAAKDMFPREFKPMWSVKATELIEGGNHFELVAIKALKDKAPLDGEAVKSARAEYGTTSTNSHVSMTMKPEGAGEWAKITKQNIGKQVAIVLDGVVYSYPTVQGAIEGGQSQITGNFTREEAEDLANVLECGKLPAPATIIKEQVVGPTLGEKSIKAGLISFVIAFCLVLLYMIIFYQGAGLIADIALICNVILLMGALVSFGAALTLPGIAGLVLTLGMAVDANVIIYERVKEELRAGKGLSKAVIDGYSNAYSAIIDGQITTLITGIILFAFGSGPVQGFATTLIIGIITSVLTSIFITRILIDDRVSKGKKVSFDNKFTRNFLQNTKINFLGKRKIAYIVSGLLIVGSLVSIFTKGFTYGVDFTGGRSYTIQFDQKVDVEDVRKAIADGFDKSSTTVKQFGEGNQMMITTTYKMDSEDSEVSQLLHKAIKGLFKNEIEYEQFKDAAESDYGIISADKVGPSIAEEIKTSAIFAVLLSLLAIFGYIAVRFRGWTWGLGGVVGLAHTALIVIGFFSVFSGILPFSLDIDQTFIAAILTIVGYAINDTVVIFDRIREFKELHPKADFKTNVNAALNSTLSRTMNTSITTLITMVAIAIFGGEVIRGLAVALIIGIVVGTYASIFIATSIMYDVTKKADAKKAEK